MTDATNRPTASRPHCWSCRADIGAGDRFCRACGAYLTAAGGRLRGVTRKTGRRVAALMFLTGIAILLFAAVHRNPADLILVFAFALPLCGAGALAWRMQ